jgi:hypothetical protein
MMNFFKADIGVEKIIGLFYTDYGLSQNPDGTQIKVNILAMRKQMHYHNRTQKLDLMS